MAKMLYAILPYFPGKWTIVHEAKVRDDGSYSTGYTEGYGEMAELLAELETNVPIIDYRHNNRSWECLEIFEREVKPHEENPEYSGTLNSYLESIHARGIAIHNWKSKRELILADLDANNRKALIETVAKTRAKWNLTEQEFGKYFWEWWNS